MKLVAVIGVVAMGLAANAAVRIAEICPKPTARDANDRESGWIELVNAGETAEDLSGYELQRFNRGKAAKAGKFGNLPALTLQPGERALVWTSEEYDNAEDMGGDGKTVKTYGNLVVVPFKVNPKKYPLVRLLKGKTVVDSFIVPVDLGDDRSFARADETYAEGPARFAILPHATPGAANDYTGAVPYGPNAGPLYGLKHGASDWKPFPLAQPGEPYAVTLAVNPLSDHPDNAIAAVTLRYRLDFGAVGEVAMEKGAVDENEGQLWTATIPVLADAKPGSLLRWAATVTDGSGAAWTTPSFCNPDDGYQWYGTLYEPSAAQLSEKLQTLHLFVEGESLTQMDVDADKQDLTKVPYNARCGIFDSQTGFYYDNVRIDLRGNASASLKKKSHGLKFSKCQPLVCTDTITGEEIECRKSSFIAEYCDPAKVRQALGFRVLRDMGGLAPFDYPVRLNLNGAFYQLAFHSERFSDELIEDHYKLDKYGYSYKNVGTFKSLSTDAGAIEKKTPDDGNESDLSVLKVFIDSIAGADKISETLTGADGMASEIPAVTKTVVKTFDLPAWLNYLAATRITQEADDVNANLSAYYDVNGTGTWMPLAYDFNVSWGTSYGVSFLGRIGEMSNLDWFKSHPFFSGYRVRAHQGPTSGSFYNYGNRAVEAVWQSPKFRRLYLRRLRSVMDQVLREPGTTKEETPFWDYVTSITNAIAADLELDHQKWGYKGSVNYYIWSNEKMELDEAIASLWDNYVVPRRIHLFETHAASNTAKPIGYGRDFNAGIPAAQAPTAELKDGFSFANLGVGGAFDPDALVIRNANAEAVDLTDWTLSGAIEWTFPAGTVVDAEDVLIVTRDRKSYVAAHEKELTDQVIVGNASFAGLETTPLVLADADGTEVVRAIPPAVVALGDAVSVPGTDYLGATVTMPLGDDFAANGNEVTATLSLDGTNLVLVGTIDAEAKTVSFAVDAEALAARHYYTGEVTVTAGSQTWTHGVLLAQGTVRVVAASDGWIREGEREVSGEEHIVPTNPAPERAEITIRTRMYLGWGVADEFDASAQAGVKIVDVGGEAHYAFWTGDGLVTNAAVASAAGEEADVEAALDYRVGKVTYKVNGETFGPFPIAGANTRLLAADLKGEGRLAYLNGDYRQTELDANLVRLGDTEYATVAEAVAARGKSKDALCLLWDASWAPTTDDECVFDLAERQLVTDGAAKPVRFIDNGDGTVTVKFGKGKSARMFKIIIE